MDYSNVAAGFYSSAKTAACPLIREAKLGFFGHLIRFLLLLQRDFSILEDRGAVPRVGDDADACSLLCLLRRKQWEMSFRSIRQRSQVFLRSECSIIAAFLLDERCFEDTQTHVRACQANLQ